MSLRRQILRRTAMRKVEAERSKSALHGAPGNGVARNKRGMFAAEWRRYGGPAVRDASLSAGGRRVDRWKAAIYLWHLPDSMTVETARSRARPTRSTTSKACRPGFTRRMLVPVGCFRPWAGE